MKRSLAIALSVICLICFVSCEPVSDSDLSVTVPADSDLSATLPLPNETQASTELRAAIRYESNMNPLYPKHYATQSLLALVYEPLFKVDHEGKIIPVVAQSITYDASALTYRIQIDDQKTFHGGKRLTAQDVQASLLKTISLLAGSVPSTEGSNGVEPEITETRETGEANSVGKLGLDDLSDSYRDGAQFQATPFSLMAIVKKNEYNNIRHVSTEGNDVLLIELQKHDPHIIELLTFPIIPATDVDLRSMNPISGSGPWKVVSTGAGRLLTLERITPGTGIRQISAKAFDHAILAMEAFDSGDIDVLVLDAAETSLYADRTRIRKQRIDYPGYISLFFRDSDLERALLSRDYVASEIRSDSKGDLFAAPFASASYPILPGDFRLQNASIPEFQIADLPAPELPVYEPEPSETEETDDAGAPSPTSTDMREPFVLLLPKGFTPYRLVENIGACVARLGRKFTPVQVAKGEWVEKLRKSSYDAVLLVDVTHLFLDPVDYLESLQAAKLLDWTDYISSEDVILLREAQHLTTFTEEGALHGAFSGNAYAQSVVRTFSALPVLGLAIPETMVLYGDHVENTMAGIWYSPYENVEELIVWRP